MKIAVLSGKGGTGKTLVSVNLAAVAPRAVYVDCDVEEPNGHLFFKPNWDAETPVSVKMPVVDTDLCTGCRVCVDFCKFNALAYTDRLIIFQEICHSCGGCVLLCPQKALTEKDRTIGQVKKGYSGQVKVITGIMNPGEASGIPIIKKLLENSSAENETTLIDCPPGSACIVMETVRAADHCILVAEPTLFGVHNLSMVYELVQLFKKPHGVVLNKCLDDENPAEEFCLKNKIPIIGRIPFEHELGKLNSDALIAVRESEKYRKMFARMLETVTEEVR